MGACAVGVYQALSPVQGGPGDEARRVLFISVYFQPSTSSAMTLECFNDHLLSSNCLLLFSSLEEIPVQWKSWLLVHSFISTGIWEEECL